MPEISMSLKRPYAKAAIVRVSSGLSCFHIFQSIHLECSCLKAKITVSRFPPALFWSRRLTMHSVPLGYCSSSSFHASSLHVPYIVHVVKQRDAEEMFRPFLGSWWPSWSIRSMTLPTLSFFFFRFQTARLSLSLAWISNCSQTVSQ